MNEFRFSDLSVGHKEEFTRTISEEDMDVFRKLSGDVNPLHMDSGFATERGFNDKVVFGMLTASLISTLGGVYLPGKHCIIQEVETKFLRPVYPGDTLTVTGTVKEMNDTVEQVVTKVEIRNQDGVKVVRGTLKTGFLK